MSWIGGEPIILRLRFGFRTPKVELYMWGVCEGQHVGSGLKCYVVDMGGELDVGVALTNRRSSLCRNP